MLRESLGLGPNRPVISTFRGILDKKFVFFMVTFFVSKDSCSDVGIEGYEGFCGSEETQVLQGKG